MRAIIIQPGKVGDIICCLPIAKRWADLGYQVEWLCPIMYHAMFNYTPYVTPVLKQKGSYQKVIDLSFGLSQHSNIHKRWLKERNGGLDSFVTLKYSIAGVPIEMLRELEYNRDLNKEKALYDLLKIEGDYALIHESSDYRSSIEDILPPFENSIQFRPITGYSIFDWRMVIEQAAEIHCIDSSLANFADACNPMGELNYYITDRVPKQADRTILMKDWIVHNLLEYANS